MEKIRKELILRAMDWHEGQGSVIYALCSTALTTEDDDGFCSMWNHDVRKLVLNVERYVENEGSLEDEAFALGAELRHSIGLLTMSEIANAVTGHIQDARNVSGVARYMVRVIDTLRFEGETERGHPFMYLLMDKLASMGLYKQNVDGPEFGRAYDDARKSLER